MPLAEKLQDVLQAAFPDATVRVADPMQDDTHLTCTIVAPGFSGLNRIERHRQVYAALGNAFENELHALQMNLKAPAE